MNAPVFEVVLGGIQLTLILLAARIAYSFGTLNEKVDQLSASVAQEQTLIRHIMEEGDELRERVAVVEARITGHKG